MQTTKKDNANQEKKVNKFLAKRSAIESSDEDDSDKESSDQGSSDRRSSDQESSDQGSSENSEKKVIKFICQNMHKKYLTLLNLYKKIYLVRSIISLY